MLPKGWTQSPLGESVRIHSGHAPSDLNLLPEGEIPYVKVEDLNNCEKYQTDSREYLSACRSVVPAQALIFPKRGAAIFANKIRIAARPLALDTNLMGVEVVSGLDPEYLYYAISFAGLHRLADTSTIPQLNNKHVLPHVLPRPSLKEQLRIAQILDTWDQAIVTAERLLANSQRQRLGLTQTLISDRSRQARGMPTLPREHASAIFLPRSVRRNDGLELLSVMQDVGVVPRSSLDRKVVMPEGSTDGYKLVEPGDFVISLRSFEGGLEYSRFRGLVSPAYTVLMPAKSPPASE